MNTISLVILRECNGSKILRQNDTHINQWMCFWTGTVSCDKPYPNTYMDDTLTHTHTRPMFTQWITWIFRLLMPSVWVFYVFYLPERQTIKEMCCVCEREYVNWIYERMTKKEQNETKYMDMAYAVGAVSMLLFISLYSKVHTNRE